MNPHFFKLAREESFKATYGGTARIGCIIVYRGGIIARGSNSNKTHTFQDISNLARYKNVGNRYLPSLAHAEITALAKIRYLDIDFSTVSVYVYRELRNGSLAMSRPCPACIKEIREMGIQNIYYTTPEGYCHERLI